MNDERGRPQAPRPASRILGSLRDALAAASREDPTKASHVSGPGTGGGPATEHPAATMQSDRLVPSAAEAAREARAGTPNIPPLSQPREADAPPTTRVLRAEPKSIPTPGERTQLVRGKAKIVRGVFHQDPVVGWLVVVGGPGLGAHRPIFEGNNTVGRSPTQRIPIDFGDDSISSEEQAYIRYDSSERSFLFVPNLSKPNVVSVNDRRPTGAVVLSAMDVITMGRTQLVFIPFCGPEFDWSEITDAAD
ncbi:MAG TPA: FHA domain-containing protein [Hyphomicrobiaceae bacterium]|nr:FHA domain-containing protein [Hyphomicrobiaceae bacterium]